MEKFLQQHIKVKESGPDFLQLSEPDFLQTGKCYLMHKACVKEDEDRKKKGKGTEILLVAAIKQ